jgi:hypothetical protein
MVAREEKPRSWARRAQSTSSRPGTSSTVFGSPMAMRTSRGYNLGHPAVWPGPPVAVARPDVAALDVRGWRT